MQDQIIYHVTTANEWELAKQEGEYIAPSLAFEGFIHCSVKQQVQGVLERYYAGITDLVLLVIDTALVTAPLKYELAPSVNEEFPHIFGPINLDAVIAVEAIN